jgi:hypothetical protein
MVNTAFLDFETPSTGNKVFRLSFSTGKSSHHLFFSKGALRREWRSVKVPGQAQEVVRTNFEIII